MIKISERKNFKLTTLDKTYLGRLVDPLPAYWEQTMLYRGKKWDIYYGNMPIGYFSVNSQRQLLQFFISDGYLTEASKAFESILASGLACRALAATLDPLLLALCLEKHKAVSVHAYLFYDTNEIINYESKPFAFRVATLLDVCSLGKFYYHNAKTSREQGRSAQGDYTQFVSAMIAKQQLYLLCDGDKILGTGELRISGTQKPYADLGVNVAMESRNHGLGSYILIKLKEECYRNRLTPICDCSANNNASKKAIEKAGFFHKHSILDITLD